MCDGYCAASCDASSDECPVSAYQLVQFDDVLVDRGKLPKRC